MEKLKQIIIETVKLIGLVLLVDLVLVAGVAVSCWMGDGCTTIMWSDRMFWIGLAICMVAGPMAIGYFGSGRLLPKGMSTEGWESPFDSRNRLSDEERKAQMAQVGMWALRLGLVGAFAIAIGILIEVLSR